MPDANITSAPLPERTGNPDADLVILWERILADDRKLRALDAWRDELRGRQ